MRKIFHRVVLIVSVIALLPIQVAGAAVQVSSASFSSATTGVVSGWSTDFGGFVSYTADGGRTFRAWTPGTSLQTAGAAIRGDKVVALGLWKDFVMSSADAGLNFEQSSGLLNQTGSTYVTGVEVMSGGRLVVVGRREGNESGGELDGVSVAGQPAFIRTSDDMGATWTTKLWGPVYPPPSEYEDAPYSWSSLEAVDAEASGTAAWAVGREGKKTVDGESSVYTYIGPLIRKTTDGGDTWVAQTVTGISLPLGLSYVAAASASNVFAADGSKYFIRSLTGGSTWTRHEIPYDNISKKYIEPRSIAASGTQLLVAGRYGLIAFSNSALDATPAFKFFTVLGMPMLRGAAILDANNWIVVGDNETIARTSDAGENWSVESAKPPTAAITGPAQGFVLGNSPLTINGTASDIGLGVREVEVRVRRSDGLHFNGLKWQAAEFWLPATSTDSWNTWSYTWAENPALEADGKMVTLTARARDAAGYSALSTSVGSGLPITASISLDGGASSTQKTTIPVQISAAGATHMRWRVNSGSWTDKAYATTENVTLTTGDGNKVVDFEFSTDNFTSVAAQASKSIVLHTTLPSVAISSPSDGFSISGEAVNISGTASDSGGVDSVGLRIRRADGQHWNGTAWQTTEVWLPADSSDGFATWSRPWTPEAVLSAVTITARATDEYGLRTTTGYITSAGQEGASIMLDGGAAVTTDTGVQVSVSAPGASEMRWSGHVVDAPVSWVSVQTSLPVTLTSGDGMKTVEFRFRDGSSIETTASNAILLHTSVPTVTIGAPAAPGFPLTESPIAISGTASDEGGSVADVMLRIRRSDNRSWDGAAWQTADSWVSPSSDNGYANWTYSWTPDAATLNGDHIVTLTAKVTDSAGLDSTSRDLTSGLPLRALVSLDDGAAYTGSLTTPVSISSKGATHMRWSVNDGATKSAWVPVSESATVTLPAGDGTKTATFYFSANGTDSALEVSDDIILDRTLPTVVRTSPAPGFVYRTDGTAVKIEGDVWDTGSGVSAVQISITQDDRHWSGVGWVSEPTWIDATVNSGSWGYAWLPDAEAKASPNPVTVAVRAIDAVGNTAAQTVKSQDPLDKTALSLTTRSGTLAYRGTGYIRGVLTVENATGDMVPASGTVQLYQKPYGASAYKLVPYSTKTLSSTGAYSYAVKPYAKTTYQVRFAPTAARLKAVSPLITFTPKVYLSRPSGPKIVRRTSTWTSSGYLKPRHAAGSYPVRIYRQRYVGGKWVAYGYVKAKASNYSSYTKYARALRLAYPGKWRIRAYHVDGAHAASYSSWRYIRVY